MSDQFKGVFDISADFDTSGMGDFGNPSQPVHNQQETESFDLDDDVSFNLDEDSEHSFDLDGDFDTHNLGPQTAIANAVPNAPLYLSDDYTEVGRFGIQAQYIREFYDSALHLDKKDLKTHITMVVVNNYCFIYSLNIGIEMYATFGCDYPNSQPLVFSVPINKILKLLNTDEIVIFDVEDDEIFIEKTKMRVSIIKPTLFYIKECEAKVNELYSLYEQGVSDEFSNTELYTTLNILNVYSKYNQADKRTILFTGTVAYVRSVGYYVFRNHQTNNKYLINTTFAGLLLKLCKSTQFEEFPVKVIVNEDVYTVISNNYVLNFPIIEGNYKFNALGKIHPTAVYQLDKKEVKTALTQLDLYTEKKCALTLGDTALLQNKTVQGNAMVEVGITKLEDSRNDKLPSTYLFDYDKFTRVLGPIRSDNMIIMECNTQEHLYLTDDKMSFYIILSVK